MFEGKLFTGPKYRGLLFRDYHSQCDCANLPPRRKLTNQSINDFLSIRTFLVSYSQPIRLVRFGGKAVDRGLPKLKQTKARDSWFWLKRGQHVGTRMIDWRKKQAVKLCSQVKFWLHCETKIPFSFCSVRNKKEPNLIPRVFVSLYQRSRNERPWVEPI